MLIIEAGEEASDFLFFENGDGKKTCFVRKEGVATEIPRNSEYDFETDVF